MIQNLNFQWNEKFNFFYEIYINIFYMSALYVAVSNENTEMVKLLISCQDIDVNIGYILE